MEVYAVSHKIFKKILCTQHTSVAKFSMIFCQKCNIIYLLYCEKTCKYSKLPYIKSVIFFYNYQNMNEKVLERLGLSEDEATIYLILLENPRQTVTSLSKTSGFNRPKLYRVLPAMEEA